MAYELATALLQPYGTRGIVLTTLAASVLSGAGLVAARNGLHAAMLADAQAGPGTARGAGAGPVEHRLHAAVVLIATAVTVAVVWGGASTPPTPPRPGLSGGIISSPAAATHPIASRHGGGPLGTVGLASTTTPLAVGPATVDLGSGVALTPAPRWTVFQQGPGWAVLLSDNEDATLYVDIGRAKTPDINQEAAQLVNAAIQKSGLTNVEQNPGSVQTVQGKNFQQMIQTSYTANSQTDLGTQQEYGTWATLFSPSTHVTGFVELFGYSPQDFQAAIPDGKSMLDSLL